MRLTDQDARERAARVEALLERLEAADEVTRAVAIEALEALMALYGEALARLVDHVPPDLVVGDSVIAHVLLLHGLHPIAAPTRIGRALEALEPHGARAQLLGDAVGVVPFRMRGGHGCGAMAMTRSIEDAVKQSARRAATAA